MTSGMDNLLSSSPQRDNRPNGDLNPFGEFIRARDEMAHGFGIECTGDEWKKQCVEVLHGYSDAYESLGWNRLEGLDCVHSSLYDARDLIFSVIDKKSAGCRKRAVAEVNGIIAGLKLLKKVDCQKAHPIEPQGNCFGANGDWDPAFKYLSFQQDWLHVRQV